MTSIPPIPRGLEDDPEIRARAKRLLIAAYDQALEIIEVGDPATKAQFVRALMPALTRALKDRGDDEEMERLRASVESANQSIRDAIGA